jgi:hypothetical protein
MVVEPVFEPVRWKGGRKVGCGIVAAASRELRNSGRSVQGEVGEKEGQGQRILCTEEECDEVNGEEWLSSRPSRRSC